MNPNIYNLFFYLSKEKAVCCYKRLPKNEQRVGMCLSIPLGLNTRLRMCTRVSSSSTMIVELMGHALLLVSSFENL